MLASGRHETGRGQHNLRTRLGFFPFAEADNEHAFAVLGQTVIGGVQHTIAYVVYASPDGAQPSQNNTQCFRVVSHEALDILEQKRPRPLGVNGLDDAKNIVPRPRLSCRPSPTPITENG